MAQYTKTYLVLALACAPACLKHKVGTAPHANVDDQRSGPTLTKVPSTVSETGASTGSVSAASNQTQVLEAGESTEIKGSAVSFPPGSVAIDTNISLAPAPTLSTTAFTNAVGLGADVKTTATAPAVTIASSVPMDAAKPFVIDLPIPNASSLDLVSDPLANLVVFYTITKVATGQQYAGIFPRSLLEIVNGKVEFSTLYFGTFQAVITVAPVTTAVEVVTTAAQVATRKYYQRGIKISSFDTGSQTDNGFQAWGQRTPQPVVANSTGPMLLTDYVVRLESN